MGFNSAFKGLISIFSRYSERIYGVALFFFINIIYFSFTSILAMIL